MTPSSAPFYSIAGVDGIMKAARGDFTSCYGGILATGLCLRWGGSVALTLS